MINEFIQWAVLVFLAIFVFGLTRQLGLYIVPRQQQLEDLGPQLNKVVPSKLIAGTDRTRLAQLLKSSQSGWAGIIVVDEACNSCSEMVEDVLRHGVPDDAPMVAITNATETDLHKDLMQIVDLIIVDPKAEKTQQAGIHVTPFVMIVDERLRLVHKQVGDLRFAVEQWKSRSDHIESRPAPKTSDNGRHKTGVSRIP